MAKLLKITAKRQVTFPAHVLDELGVGPGDRLVLEEFEGSYLLRPRRVDREKLAPLHGKLQSGGKPFDLEKFRKQGHDPALRD